MKIRSLRLKVILFTVFSVTLVGSLFYGALAYIVVNNQQQMEQAEAKRVGDRITAGVESATHDLKASVLDWARWDEPYAFLSTGDRFWVDQDITPDMLWNLHFGALATLDASGHCAFSVVVSGRSAHWDEAEGQEFCRAVGGLAPGKGATLPVAGMIVKLPDEKSYLVAADAIVKNDGSGPSPGVLVAGTPFDTTMAANISKYASFPVTIVDETDHAEKVAYAGAKHLDDDVAYWAGSGSSYNVYKRVGDPAGGHLILKAEVPRSLVAIGYSTLRGFAAVLALFILSLIFILAWTTSRLILQRVERLGRGVDLVSANGGAADTVPVEGDDELARLGHQIRVMVDNLALAKHKAESLADDLEKFQLAVESATDMIIIADANFRILYANRSFLAASGFSAEKIVGQSVLGIWDCRDGAKRLTIRDRLEKEHQTWQGDTGGCRADGGAYVAELNAAPILGPDGKLRFVVSILRDVTQAKEIDRMKSEFVSIASHQLKTPLTGIKWFSEMIMQEEGSNLTAEQRDFLHQIYEVNERMISLVNDLLNVSRIESGRKFSIERKPTEVIGLVKQIAAEQGVLAKRRRVKVTVLPDVPETLTLDVDAEKFRQVVGNLVNNAVKYSQEGGEVRLGLTLGPAEAEFMVADDGLGIPAAQQGRIFEKFFRADNALKREGTGLGMYIVKAIVEGHGGRIWFDSKEGVGTVFRFTMPRPVSPPTA